MNKLNKFKKIISMLFAVMMLTMISVTTYEHKVNISEYAVNSFSDEDEVGDYI